MICGGCSTEDNATISATNLNEFDNNILYCTMKIKRLIPVLLVFLMLSTSCEFVGNTLKYKDITKAFVNALNKDDYNKALTYMALDHQSAKNINIDTLKKGLSNFKMMLSQKFGAELEYSFVSATKTFSTEETNNTTNVQIQLANKEVFGMLNVVFDDKSNKILNINILDINQPIPSMTFFWLFGLLALCIPAFNIYIIRLIKRSELKKKWVKYLAVIFLNAPSITYNAVTGLSFKLISFQFLFGIGFGFMGYLNSVWTFGIPLGGLYWLWRLKQRQKNEAHLISNFENEDIIPAQDLI
jgi:hypothetical protein